MGPKANAARRLGGSGAPEDLLRDLGRPYLDSLKSSVFVVPLVMVAAADLLWYPVALAVTL